MTVNRGDALKLPCYVSSTSSLSSVTWIHLEKASEELFHIYKNGEVFRPLQYRINVSDPSAGDFSLIHDNIQKDDAGRYMCCLENAACSGQMMKYIYTVYVTGVSIRRQETVVKCLLWKFLFHFIKKISVQCLTVSRIVTNIYLKIIHVFQSKAIPYLGHCPS